VILLLLVSMFLYSSFNPSGSLEWSDFIYLLNTPEQAKNLKRVVFRGTDELIVEVENVDTLPDEMKKKVGKNKRFTVQRLKVNEDKEVVDKLHQLAMAEPEKNGTRLRIDQEEQHFAWLGGLMMMLLPLLLFIALFFFLLPRFRDPMGGGFLSNYIKSPARRYERTKQRTTFDDVAGMQNAKSELQEMVEFLRTPEKFARLGAVVPKGVLLVGPPGTGKTLLARAVAGEANVPFYSISGSEFIQMFVGVGASRVRDLFKTAKENAPCVIFIDEIDAVGRMRGAGVGGGSDEREQTLNQILSEMDGFLPNETVIVLAATNRPDVLDSALLRPGRFDRHITIDRPTWQGRLAILKVHTRNKPLADDVNLETLAKNMVGMSGADLRNLANEAALLATREGKNKIEHRDFEAAIDRVLRGPKREEVLTEKDKRHTAVHEIGHALVGFLEEHADPPAKVSIIPRGRSLGVTFSIPDEDRVEHSEEHMKARLTVMLGGRAADRLYFGQVYSGHEDDLRQASRLARYMITHWGMSERLGPVSFRIGEEHIFLGKEIQEPRDFSEGTAQMIDEEVRRILTEADHRAFEHLESNRDKMDRLVEALLQREELLREEMEALLRMDDNGQMPTSTAIQEKKG
jgi:cell division protease FtsH